MQIPTIKQFNAWSEKDKLWWLDLETEGNYKNMERAKGYFPFLIYDKQDVGIVYQVNSKGQLTEAIAMTVKEAFDRLIRFHEASKAVRPIN